VLSNLELKEGSTLHSVAGASQSGKAEIGDGETIG
jgi:hypothetical protein